MIDCSTGSLHQDTQQTFSRLAALALKGLERMLLDDMPVFCDRALGRDGGEMLLSGTSLRYTAMSLIGLAAYEQVFGPTGWDQRARWSQAALWDNLVAWASQQAEPGDAGLVLWGLIVRNDDRAEQVLQTIRQRQNKLAQICRHSMPLGWLLTGLGLAMQKGICLADSRTLAGRVFDLLLANRCSSYGLFSLARPGLRRNFLAGRVYGRLGSFASQVYPMIGLSHYAIAGNLSEPLQMARQCADRICQLQGPQGQWWWIYNTRTGLPAVNYPVYSVHQDAMGPMALLAVSRAGGGCGYDYDPAIKRSLDWLENHTECSHIRLISEDASLVWRAIQRDRHDRTGNFGLGRGERLRMQLAAWLDFRDERRFDGGHLCRECRPYHLGWILLAAAWYAARERKGNC
jgi:hypothetical protein